MRRSLSGLWLAGFAVLACAAAHAGSPEDIVKYRTNIMKANGGLMSAAGAIVKGKVDYQPQLAGEALALEAATRDLAALFPPGTENIGDTEALPEVWSKRPEFEQRARDAETTATAFAQATQGGNAKAVADAYDDLAAACKSCHKEFRK